MTSRQEAKLSMYDAVVSYCSANSTIMSTVPAFETAFNAFQNIFTSLQTNAALELNQTTGITINKRTIAETLIQQANIIAGAVFAFATANNNYELKEQSRFTVSKLRDLKDELLAPACTNIHDLAAANLVALAPFGITQPVLDDLIDIIEDYEEVIAAPRNAAAQKANYGTTIDDLFASGDDILKNQLDKMAPTFKAANPAFFNNYKTNRIIIDPGTSHTQVVGTIIGNPDTAPLFGVIITVEGQSYAASANANGEYKLKIPVPGTYSITFTKTGYWPKTLSNITVTLGQTTPLDVTLEVQPS